VLIHNLILDGSVCLPPLRMRCYFCVRFVCSAGSDSPLSLGDDKRAALRGVGLDRCDPWTHTAVLTYTRRNATSNSTKHELVIRPRSGQDKAAGLDVDLGALDQILSPFPPSRTRSSAWGSSAPMCCVRTPPTARHSTT
jgi:hypothetical protein